MALHLHDDYTTCGEGITFDYARRYVELGYWVLPLAPRSKVPFEGSHGLYDATNDLQQLREAFTSHPDANIAIVPSRSKLTVLDIDYRNGGKEILADLHAHFGPGIFNTVSVQKPTGPHFYYSQAEDALPVDMAAQMRSGFDLIGSGSYAVEKYVIVPPSIHPDGFPYLWAKDHAPWEHSLLSFPTDIYSGLVKPVGSWEDSPQKTKGRSKAEDKQTSELCEYDKDPRLVHAVANFLGVPFKPNTAILSPLRIDKHPSACIYLRPDGYYRYHDFGRGKSSEYYALAQVYGAKVTGCSSPLPQLRGSEFSRWQIRMLLDLDWLEVPSPVSVTPLPSAAPMAAVTAYEGYRLLLMCEVTRNGKIAPVPYTYGFCARWTGLKPGDAEAGVKWLRDNGFLVTVGKHKAAYGRAMDLYLPPNYAAVYR